ncbi:TcpK family conjugal transfer DNA-binding protein, partial [Clostridium perfringens]|uniref:TcpK family conjugal transfer DNA-binding protein n=1 Tax=Clostridium perfringens TaxID=1502 RepID=UPI002247F7BF
LSKDIQEYYVKKKDLEKLLAVNNYDTVDGKLSVWRAIGLINIRENRYTKQVRIKGKIINVVALKVSAYNALKKLEVEKKLCEK